MKRSRYVFALFQENLRNASDSTDEHTIPTFLTLYIFGFIYQLLLVYDALRLKNTIQIIGLCLFNNALLIYAAVQMTQINDAISVLGDHIDHNVWNNVKPFLIAVPCVIALGTIAMSFVARKLYDEFAWTIYKHISADLRMKRRYLTYQVSIYLSMNIHRLIHSPRFTLLFSNSTSSSSSALLFNSSS